MFVSVFFLLFLCISANGYVVIYNDDTIDTTGSVCFGLPVTSQGDTIVVDVTSMEYESLPILNLTGLSFRLSKLKLVSNENCDGDTYQVVYTTSTAINNHYTISYISPGTVQFFSVTPSGSQQNYQITVTSGSSKCLLF